MFAFNSFSSGPPPTSSLGGGGGGVLGNSGAPSFAAHTPKNGNSIGNSNTNTGGGTHGFQGSAAPPPLPPPVFGTSGGVSGALWNASAPPPPPAFPAPGAFGSAVPLGATPVFHGGAAGLSTALSTRPGNNSDSDSSNHASNAVLPPAFPAQQQQQHASPPPAPLGFTAATPISAAPVFSGGGGGTGVLGGPQSTTVQQHGSASGGGRSNQGVLGGSSSSSLSTAAGPPTTQIPTTPFGAQKSGSGAPVLASGPPGASGASAGGFSWATDAAPSKPSAPIPVGEHIRQPGTSHAGEPQRSPTAFSGAGVLSGAPTAANSASGAAPASKPSPPPPQHRKLDVTPVGASVFGGQSQSSGAGSGGGGDGGGGVLGGAPAFGSFSAAVFKSGVPAAAPFSASALPIVSAVENSVGRDAKGSSSFTSTAALAGGPAPAATPSFFGAAASPFAKESGGAPAAATAAAPAPAITPSQPLSSAPNPFGKSTAFGSAAVPPAAATAAKAPAFPTGASPPPFFSLAAGRPSSTFQMAQAPAEPSRTPAVASASPSSSSFFAAVGAATPAAPESKKKEEAAVFAKAAPVTTSAFASAASPVVKSAFGGGGGGGGSSAAPTLAASTHNATGTLTGGSAFASTNTAHGGPRGVGERNENHGRPDNNNNTSSSSSRGRRRGRSRSPPEQRHNPPVPASKPQQHPPPASTSAAATPFAIPAPRHAQQQRQQQQQLSPAASKQPSHPQQQQQQQQQRVPTTLSRHEKLPVPTLPADERQWSIVARLFKSFLLQLASPAPANGSRETGTADLLEKAFFGVAGCEGVSGDYAKTAGELLAVWTTQVRPVVGSLKGSDAAPPLQGEVWVAIFSLGTYLNVIVSTLTTASQAASSAASADLAVYKAGLREHPAEALTDACHYANELSELLQSVFQRGSEADAPPYSIIPVVLRRVRTVFEEATARGVATVQSNLNAITSKLFAVLNRRVKNSAVQPRNAAGGGTAQQWLLMYDSKEKESLLHSFAHLLIEMIAVDAPMNEDVELFIAAFHECLPSALAERCMLYYRKACALLRQPLRMPQVTEAAELLAKALAVYPPDAAPHNRRVLQVRLLTTELALGRLLDDEARIALDVPALVDVVNAVKTARLDLLDAALNMHGPFFVQIGVHNVLMVARQRVALMMVVKYYLTHNRESRLSVEDMVRYHKLPYTASEAALVWLLPLLVEKCINGVLDHGFLVLSNTAPFDDYPRSLLVPSA